MKRDRHSHVRLVLKRLEVREVPGTLNVTPPAPFIDPTVEFVEVPDAAQPGLHSAQVHSGGVISWFVDPSNSL
jgi:hypothetical protein